MTEGEKSLWKELKELRKSLGIHVRKQAPISPYVVDFVVQKDRLVIEVDGEFHETAARKERDMIRDGWFQKAGYRVMRINTGELEENLDGCIETILHELGLIH